MLRSNSTSVSSFTGSGFSKEVKPKKKPYQTGIDLFVYTLYYLVLIRVLEMWIQKGPVVVALL
jgi:hypothetical protein